MNVWAFIHNAVSHPLMALTKALDEGSVSFHDWSAEQAWPSPPVEVGPQSGATLEPRAGSNQDFIDTNGPIGPDCFGGSDYD